MITDYLIVIACVLGAAFPFAVLIYLYMKRPNEPNKEIIPVLGDIHFLETHHENVLPPESSGNHWNIEIWDSGHTWHYRVPKDSPYVGGLNELCTMLREQGYQASSGVVSKR